MSRPRDILTNEDFLRHFSDWITNIDSASKSFSGMERLDNSAKMQPDWTRKKSFGYRRFPLTNTVP